MIKVCECLEKYNFLIMYPFCVIEKKLWVEKPEKRTNSNEMRQTHTHKERVRKNIGNVQKNKSKPCNLNPFFSSLWFFMFVCFMKSIKTHIYMPALLVSHLYLISSGLWNARGNLIMFSFSFYAVSRGGGETKKKYPS